MSDSFKSSGSSLRELGNAFTASRDTNISPGEAYDTIVNPQIVDAAAFARKSGRTPTALDVGCGAGVSTEILYNSGFSSIDAVDWSGEAWRKYVVDEGHCPSSVTFYEVDDETFVNTNSDVRAGVRKYDVIIFNFAVNDKKAKAFTSYLTRSPASRLLAPVNTQEDYWLKQQYKIYDYNCAETYSATDVGAWSVQFQPDVTQDTCQGIWCPPFNGFKKKR